MPLFYCFRKTLIRRMLRGKHPRKDSGVTCRGNLNWSSFSLHLSVSSCFGSRHKVCTFLNVWAGCICLEVQVNLIQQLLFHLLLLLHETVAQNHSNWLTTTKSHQLGLMVKQSQSNCIFSRARLFLHCQMGAMLCSEIASNVISSLLNYSVILTPDDKTAKLHLCEVNLKKSKRYSCETS